MLKLPLHQVRREKHTSFVLLIKEQNNIFLGCESLERDIARTTEALPTQPLFSSLSCFAPKLQNFVPPQIYGSDRACAQVQ